MKIVPQSVELLCITPQPEKQIEIAGRTCYKSEDRITEDSAGEFCRRMVKSGHHAMIEHASASFRIITDRGVSHEIVRHRIASYAQESTRYCNYGADKFGKEIAVIRPPKLIMPPGYGRPRVKKRKYTISLFSNKVAPPKSQDQSFRPA